MTRSTLAACLLAAAGLVSACTPSLMTATRPRAVETAETRARYDLQCPDAKGQVVASQLLPAKQAPPPLGSPDALPHTQFDIGISGCGTPRKVTVLCSQEDGCFAGAPV